MGASGVYDGTMRARHRTRRPVRLAVLGLVAALFGQLAGCASGGGSAPGATSSEQPELRMAPERVFDAERPFIRGNPVGIELHWWLVRDSEDEIARSLAPYDQYTDFLDEPTRERLRLSGLRAVAVPLSEVFVVHQIASPSSPWSRRWLGQSPDWVQLMRSRRIADGTRSDVYGSEQRLPGGVLRLLGRGWIVPERTGVADDARIEAAMRIEVVGQIQQRNPARENNNPFRIPTADSVSPPLDDQGPLINELLLEITVPRGYAIVLTAAAPSDDWSRVEGVTRDNLIEVLQQREQATPEAEDIQPEEQGSEPVRFGPSAGPSAAPSDVPTEATDDEAQVFETLDAPMPSLANSFGPRAASLPTIGQLLLESRDRMSRPLRGVVILIPRVPDEFQLLP